MNHSPALLALALLFPLGVQAQGQALIEVLTVPQIAGDTLRFAGIPDGLLELRIGQPNRLTSDPLGAGTYVSTLSQIGPILAFNGYSLESISCDDAASPRPSTGDVSSGTATFHVDESETVVCQFKLTASSCVCPLDGEWTASNLPGSMVCTGAFNLTAPLAPSTDTGRLAARNGCSTVFATDFSDDTADITMRRGSSCSYAGTVGGLQDGIPMEIHFTWDVQSPRHIIGALRSQIVERGATCTMTRPIELRFNE